MELIETSVTIDEVSTDAEAVAALQASGVTARKIDLAYLMELLNFRGMLRKTDGSGGQERWVGTLQNLKAALVAMNQAAMVTAYETWFSHVTNPRQSYWDTTQPEYAAGFWAMRSAFADGDGMPSSADFAAVAALGGGWLFADLTAEQYAADQAEAAAKAAAAYLVGADVLLSVNRTGGQLRVSMNVSRDGKQVRLASLTEGQGSVADQALTSAIESAIDAWLVGA